MLLIEYNINILIFIIEYISPVSDGKNGAPYMSFQIFLLAIVPNLAALTYNLNIFL